jgi:2,4-dienoyl-CoA reductase (NADPH2)
VTLCEADANLGGNLRYSRRFPHRELIGDVADWLEAEVERLGVDVRRSTPVDADLVAELAPDVVVVASGANPKLPAGAWTSAQVSQLDEPPEGVGSAVIVDPTGSYEAIGAAELLVGWGVDVTVVTPLAMLGMGILRELVLVPALARLQAGPGRFDVVTKADPQAPLPTADLVVVIAKEAAPDRLGLPPGVEVLVVGDAGEPGNLWAAVRTGNAAGRAV